MQSEMAHDAIRQLSRQGSMKATVAFSLLNHDINGAVISYGLFEQLKLSGGPADIAAMMYHGSCFVCCVRRVGRLLEAFSENEIGFPQHVLVAIKLEQKKKRAFFKSFIDPRNAIEHIDGEVKSMTRFEAFNLFNDRFQITNGTEVSIDKQAVVKLLSVRDVIAEAILDSAGS